MPYRGAHCCNDAGDDELVEDIMLRFMKETSSSSAFTKERSL